MKTLLVTAAAIAAGWLSLFAGCGFLPESNQPGLVRLNLTDSPGDYEAVSISIGEVSVRKQDDPSVRWTTFPLNSHDFDLICLQNGQTAMMGEEKLDPGVYSQMRLRIESASVSVAGQIYELEIPETNSGFELDLADFEVKPGLTYDLILDFDTARSIIRTASREQLIGYRLDPVIRASLQANTGAVRGLVSDGTHLPRAFAIAGRDTVSRTLVDTVTWEFLLGYLPGGTYLVVVEDTTGAGASYREVTVTAGRTVDLGELALLD
jgi:hypothetical protein